MGYIWTKKAKNGGFIVDMLFLARSFFQIGDEGDFFLQKGGQWLRQIFCSIFYVQSLL